LADQKQGAAVRSYLLHFSLAGVQLANYHWILLVFNYSLAGVQLCCAFYQP